MSAPSPLMHAVTTAIAMQELKDSTFKALLRYPDLSVPINKTLEGLDQSIKETPLEGLASVLKEASRKIEALLQERESAFLKETT